MLLCGGQFGEILILLARGVALVERDDVRERAHARAGPGRAQVRVEIGLELVVQDFEFRLAEFGLVREKIAQMTVDCFAAESTVWMIAHYIDSGCDDYSVEAAIGKVFAGEAVNRAAWEALQIAGGNVKTDVVWLAMLALPGTLIGSRLGMRAYSALSDRNFHDLVLALLFLSGLGLVWSSIAPR